MKAKNFLLILSCFTFYSCSLFGIDEKAEVNFSMAHSEFLTITTLLLGLLMEEILSDDEFELELRED